MNVYDQAHKLARAISKSGEYRSYQKARESLLNNEQAREMFEDYRQLEEEISRKHMSDEEVTEQEIKRLRDMRDLLSSHSVINGYLQSEERLSVLLMDIQRIIGEAVDMGLDTDSDEDSQLEV